MRIRVMRKEQDRWCLIAEQQTRKGTKATVGRTVDRDELRQETARLVKELRGENA